MYNMQTAKEQIDLVAKHTSTLTEYVMSLSERVQAHEGHDGKLEDFKNVVMKEIEAKFAELEHRLFGSTETAHDAPSAVQELGHKIAGLLGTKEPAGHPPEPAHQEQHQEHHHDQHHG